MGFRSCSRESGAGPPKPQGILLSNYIDNFSPACSVASIYAVLVLLGHFKVNLFIYFYKIAMQLPKFAPIARGLAFLDGLG